MSEGELAPSPPTTNATQVDRQATEKETTHEESQTGSRRHSRSRSRSPVREQRPRRKDAGFKWKEKRRDDDIDSRHTEERLRRGYRDQYKPRDRSRSRDRDRRRSRSPRRRDYNRRDGEGDRHSHERRHDHDRRSHHRDRDRDNDRRARRDEEHRERTEKKPRKEQQPATTLSSTPQQEMILVTVNDRLGTKKQIPCLPTDTVKDFKAVVAMMIGRRPHEILLKRQSERPFKDFLTLQDYGISNNVQLDLEVDTGD